MKPCRPRISSTDKNEQRQSHSNHSSQCTSQFPPLKSSSPTPAQAKQSREPGGIHRMRRSRTQSRVSLYCISIKQEQQAGGPAGSQSGVEKTKHPHLQQPPASSAPKHSLQGKGTQFSHFWLDNTSSNSLITTIITIKGNLRATGQASEPRCGAGCYSKG